MSTGLKDDEKKLLSEFTTSLTEAAAALRDVWLHADPGNAHAIEVAIAVLFQESHSMQRNANVMRKVLAHGHDRYEELITNVSSTLMDLGAIESRLGGITRRTLALIEEGRGDLSVLEEIEADVEVCRNIFREATQPAMAPDTTAPVAASSETRVNNHPTEGEIRDALSGFRTIPTDEEFAAKSPKPIR